MEFNQLESFLSVVKHRNFSKAAKELYLTQPTISNNIQNLERELDAVLLDRKSKTITLTDAGQIFYQYAQEIINLREHAKHSIAGYSDQIDGLIEINSSSIPEQFVLPYVIRDFSKIYPKVSFSINSKNSKEIINDILQGKENAGIVGTKYSSNALKYISFYEDELVLATPNNDNYPMPVDKPLPIDVLFKENLIFRKEGSGTRAFIEETLQSKDIDVDNLNIKSYINSNETIKKMIQLDLGVSLISRISIQNEIALGLIKPYTIEGLDLKRNFFFVYSSTRTLSPVMESFKSFLENYMK
ncbi:MAG: selenium metabolism-associated LysR family transcriptional regulator [Gudongella sp.]|jgi:DNA-binding transcriptional LysR family regulator|nr:selenium metabolism-associated LysR family transcriptional regulator [Gudongella sp.]